MARADAAHVLDHTHHDITRTTERYDVVLDTVGTLTVVVDTGYQVGNVLLRP